MESLYVTYYKSLIVTLAVSATVFEIFTLKDRQESRAVAGKPRDAAVNSDRYRVRWHFAGAISVSRMQSVSGCTVYA